MESNKISNLDIMTNLYVNYLDDVDQAKFLRLNKEINETLLEISRKRVLRLQCLFETCINSIIRVEIRNPNSFFELEEAYLKTLEIAREKFSQIEFIERAKLKISMDIQKDSQEKNDLLSILNIYPISKEEIANYLDENILFFSKTVYDAEKFEKIKEDLILIKNKFTGEKNVLECYQAVSDINKAYNTHDHRPIPNANDSRKIEKMFKKPNQPHPLEHMIKREAIRGRQKGMAMRHAVRDLKTSLDLEFSLDVVSELTSNDHLHLALQLCQKIISIPFKFPVIKLKYPLYKYSSGISEEFISSTEELSEKLYSVVAGNLGSMEDIKANFLPIIGQFSDHTIKSINYIKLEEIIGLAVSEKLPELALSLLLKQEYYLGIEKMFFRVTMAFINNNQFERANDVCDKYVPQSQKAFVKNLIEAKKKQSS